MPTVPPKFAFQDRLQMYHNSTGVRVKFEKAHLQAHRHFADI